MTVLISQFENLQLCHETLHLFAIYDVTLLKGFNGKQLVRVLVLRQNNFAEVTSAQHGFQSKTSKITPIKSEHCCLCHHKKSGLLQGSIDVQSTPFNSHPDNSDLRLIHMYLRPTFRDDQSNIRLIRISHYSSYFIRSLTIQIRRIQ